MEDDLPTKKRKKTYNHSVLPPGWGVSNVKVVNNLTDIQLCAPQPQRVGCRLRGNRVVKPQLCPREFVEYVHGRGDIRSYFQVLTRNTTVLSNIYTPSNGTTSAEGKSKAQVGNNNISRSSLSLVGTNGALGPTIILNKNNKKKSLGVPTTPSSGSKRKRSFVKEDQNENVIIQARNVRVKLDMCTPCLNDENTRPVSPSVWGPSINVVQDERATSVCGRASEELSMKVTEKYVDEVAAQEVSVSVLTTGQGRAGM